ncbi:hypothetical protein J5069_02905 [Candidatus Symbiopectobacterium sp. NZEC127]|uniref:hypothetical protein n=1 Tax=Candidatus Symbiopectobacterium sp. NZEC127 TaxID=2820472 RepID=UPI002227090C|nr:hypothetical protein [Candidatus Symbiopectobacterium sp. NZEC127]MCW2484840.1 hypothetical protein [Candidatus Symbiopectobacterium sp. NZEC127]
MAESISIVYIGDKDKKRDTITGSRIVFPRLVPVDVDSAMAHQLLAFPTVWVRTEQAEAVLQQNAEADAVKAQLAQDALANQLAADAANSWVVKVGNDDVDLAKLTSAQLLTLVEAEDLDLKKGAQEKVDDFRARVRSAINGEAVV